MALRSYSVLKGRASNLALDDDESPHIEVRIEAAGESHRIAVNARSQVAPHDLLYLKQDPFAHPTLLDGLRALPMGPTNIQPFHTNLALDYVRGGIVQREAMEIAPFQRRGPANDLRDFIEPLVRRAIEKDDVVFYAFGEPWGPEPGARDKYFGFLPGRGVHEIHMNQGSRGRFRSSNGPNQDGALLAYLEPEDRWVAVFLAFQSQDWRTDPHTGDPVDEQPPDDTVIDPLRPAVSIVAALVNAVGREEGGETVTLLNRTDVTVDLDGWRIADRTGRAQTLALRIAAGEAARVVLDDGPDAPRLGNKGGEIVLLTPDGAVADRVEYAKHEVAPEGWTTLF